MVEFNRRTYLKAAIASAGALTGLGVAPVLGQPDGRPGGGAPPGQSDGRPGSGDTPPGQAGGGPGAMRDCLAGTTHLATYETADADDDGSDEFVVAEGDDVVTFTAIDRTDEGEIVGFDWESSAIVAVVTATFGPNSQRFEGGFSGTVDLSDADTAIGNVTFCAPRGGRAVLCELDMDMGTAPYDTAFHFDGDPAGGTRDGVVHLTSDGTDTMDYGHAMVNVVDELGDRVTVDALETLSFDFYEGADNARAIPDEIFVSLLTDDDELKLAVRHVNSDLSSESWHTFDVLSAVTGREWSVEDVGIDDLRTSTAAVDTARDLRDSPDETVVLGDAYGDATVAGVGIGAGNTRTPTTIDRYFDDLHVEWTADATTESATFDFPAVLPVTVEDVTERGNSLVVTLSFQQSEAGISFADVARHSVTLNAYGPFVPPIEPGVVARSVPGRGAANRGASGRGAANGAAPGRDDTLVARFSADDVDDVLGADDRFIVSGDFDVPAGTALFGVGRR